MKWRVWLIVAVVLAGVVAAAGFYWPFGNRHDILKLPGVVEIQEIRLGSKLGGRVLEVNAREGLIVEAGQILVTFETPELEAQRAQQQARVQAAEAAWEKAKAGPRPEEVKSAEQAVAAAEARWKRVKRGWRDEEKLQAAGDLASAEADLQFARDRLRRLNQTRAASPSAVTQEDVDLAQASRNGAQARRDGAKAKMDMIDRGSREEDIAEAEALYWQAKNNLRILELGTRAEDKLAAEAGVMEARGKLREIETNLDEAYVRAPEKANVEILAVRKGDLVPPNQPILRILRASDLWVKVYVPETQLGKVHENQKVKVTVDSHPGRQFDGVVDYIANASEFTPRNVQSVDERRHQVFGIKVRVLDPGGVFKAGMAADVIFDF